MITRLKFEIDPVITELLDSVPIEIWESKVTTFADFSMAGGQFINQTTLKLRNHGHSDVNIKSRVFGYAEYEMYLSYVLGHIDLIGTFAVYDEEKIKNMTFDVIMGNPPFQQAHASGGVQPKSHNLWSRMIKKSFDQLNNNGYLVFITPSSWGSPSNKIFKLFKRNNLLYMNTDINDYFPNINSTFSSWVVEKSREYVSTNLNGESVDLTNADYFTNDISRTSLSIHDKVMWNSHPTYDWIGDTTSNHSSDSKEDGKWNDIETETHSYQVFHTNAQRYYSTVASKYHCDYKIMVTISGYYKPFIDSGNTSPSEIVLMIITNEAEADNLLSVLTSKLYNYIVSSAKWSGFLTKDVLRNLPKLDTSRRWTNTDIYNEFELSEDEIKYIE